MCGVAGVYDNEAVVGKIYQALLALQLVDDSIVRGNRITYKRLMTEYFPSEGNIKEGHFPSILFDILKHSISGLLIVRNEDCEKTLMIEDRKIIFAKSSLNEDSLGDGDPGL